MNKLQLRKYKRVNKDDVNRQRKKRPVILLVVGGLLLLGIGVVIGRYVINQQPKGLPLTEMISNKLSEGDFMEAYSILDRSGVNEWKLSKLNEQILKTEIASLISGSEGHSNLPKIIFAIKDRSSKNIVYSYNYHGESYDTDYALKLAESDMFDYAIEMASAVENEELVAKLKKAKPALKKMKPKK